MKKMNDMTFFTKKLKGQYVSDHGTVTSALTTYILTTVGLRRITAMLLYWCFIIQEIDTRQNNTRQN